MANYNKNILVGTGERGHQQKPLHWRGLRNGAHDGSPDTPVRRVFNYATDKYLKDMPILYVLTVVGVNEQGKQQTYGLFVGDDIEVFDRAAKLSLEVNL